MRNSADSASQLGDGDSETVVSRSGLVDMLREVREGAAVCACSQLEFECRALMCTSCSPS